MADKSGRGATTYPSKDGRIFDCPIWQAVEYVRQVIGEDGADPLLPDTKKAIRQAALDSRIVIFGKKELPSPNPPGYCSEVWTLIPSEYWQSNELGPLAAEEEWEEHEHTRGEPLIVDGYRERYWALLVNRDELIAAFPQRRPDFDDGQMRFPGGPTWVDLEYDTYFRAKKGARATVPRNRQLDREEIVQQAKSMLAAQPGISIGSAAASIVAGLPTNPKTSRPRDQRHIERIIAHLWEGGTSKSPP